METVYYFVRHIITTDEIVRSRRRATRQQIKKLGRVVLEDTALEVPVEALDEHGFVRGRGWSDGEVASRRPGGRPS